MRIWQTNPFECKVFIRGKGSRFYDDEGKAVLLQLPLPLQLPKVGRRVRMAATQVPRR